MTSKNLERYDRDDVEMALSDVQIPNSNSGQWKGDVAREIKKELKSLLKPARSRRSRR